MRHFLLLPGALVPRAEVIAIQIGQVVSSEETFDQPVFQRVKSDNAKTASGSERGLRGSQARVKFVELVVHNDAQSLESFSGDVSGSVESVLTCVGNRGRK